MDSEVSVHPLSTGLKSDEKTTSLNELDVFVKIRLQKIVIAYV